MDPFQVTGILQGGDAERVLIDQVDMPFGGAGILVFREGIRIVVPERFQHFRLTVDLHGLSVDIVEGADIVQAARMVLVLVREEDRIQVPDTLRQHLHPEIRSCIDEDLESIQLHESRCPEPFVPRVLRPAYRTLAGDDRHPLRGSRPQKRQLDFAHSTMASNWFTRAGS